MVYVLLFAFAVVAKQVASADHIKALVINIERFRILKLQIKRHIISDEVKADKLITSEN